MRPMDACPASLAESRTKPPTCRTTRLASLALAATLVASAPGSQDLRVRSYTAGDGLPGHEVEDVAQLPRGAMVFLTRRGVAFYDGLHWESAPPLPLDAMPPWRLAVGARGELLAHVGEEVWLLGEPGWRRITTAPVASSRSSHFSCMDAPEGRLRLFVTGLDGTLHLHDTGEWSSFSVPSPERGLSAVAEWNGRYLVGSEEAVLEVDPQARTSRPLDLSLPRDPAVAMSYDASSDSLWVLGTEGWIARLEGLAEGQPRTSVLAKIPAGLNPIVPDEPVSPGVHSRWDRVWDFPCASDLTGGLYFGSRLQLAYYHPRAGFEAVGRGNGLSSSSMTSLMRDHGGNMWLASTGGVNKITSRRIRSYTREEGLFADEVSAALACTDGTIVLGHGGGLTLLSPDPSAARGQHSSATLHLSARELRDRVMDLVETPAGEVWFAAGALGLGQLGPDGEAELETPDTTESISSLALHSDGESLWVASDERLFRHHEGAWDPVPFPTHLESVQTRKLYHDSKDGLYLATADDGILLLADGTFTRWTGDTPELGSCYSVLRDSAGKRWAGTKAGLAVLDDEGRLTLSAEPRLERPVYALTEDQRGQLWIGSDIGVHCWDGERLESLGKADGLVGEEANRSAAMVTPDGRVWFGSNRGISVIDDTFEVASAGGPRLELRTVEAGGEEYPLDEEQSISHDSRTLTFHFTAYSFVDEERVRFRARLEGWDKEWSQPEPNPTRTLRYTSLPPGEYRLFLQAIDARGLESPVVSSAVLRIQNPFWLRAWFLVPAASILLLGLGTSYKLREQRRFSAQLKREVQERTTEIREMEREQERLLRLESLGLLAGGIAHDFNNLLTTITGNVSLLEDEPDLPAGSRLAISDIQAASDKAAALASRLLTFSRGGSPIKEVVGIASVIRQSIRFGLLGSNVHAKIELPEELHHVEVDVHQFSQVMSNLVINARQAMKKGGTIHLRAWNEPGPPVTVVVELVDEGPGISSEVLQHIFEPYFTTKHDGHGLGLATARSIIERHGGTLSATSEPGVGTSFRITLPASTKAPGSPQSPEESAPPSPPELQVRVLVMDDQEAVRKVASAILAGAGCEVSEALEGAQAIRQYQEAQTEGSPFDIVLMDLTVPGGMGGVEATSAIRSLDPTARVIATSGYTDDDSMAHYRDYGFVGRLRKPFTADELRQAVESAIAT